MLLSISNSNARCWVKSWVLAILISSLILAALEGSWRLNGHLPSIVDDKRLWASERSKVGKAEKEIVLLGSSRMQTDISIATLHLLAPGYSIINLSADGTCANAVLNDLAKENKFIGTVLIETTPECLMFGDDPGLSQQLYVDYYHKDYNFNVIANRVIATFLQKNMTIIDPYLNLIRVAGDKIVKKKWRTPNYLTTYEDRSRSANYTKLDVEHHKILRLRKVRINYRQLALRISTQLMTQQVTNLDEAVNKIKSRGGQVAFIRFPVSGEHWDLDEEYFPRCTYWDKLPTITEAKVIHFKDVNGINNLLCPDTSHLDASDTEAFTEQLYQVLKRNHIL